MQQPGEFLALALERFVKLELVDVWIRSTNGIEFLQEPHEESPGTGVSNIAACQEAAIPAATLEAGAPAFFLAIRRQNVLALARRAVDDVMNPNCRLAK
jgi:DNA-binding NarL/FixJ family response regulator